MSGWGTTIMGLDAVFDLFEEIKVQYDGGSVYVAGPTVDYAVHNELGTSKMEARPFMRPAAERVQADPERYAKQMASTHGIDISTEEGLVKALALAVQDQGKRIADQKDIRDTGNLIASISIQKVQ
ncbi:HK97-gp10 family putative phage morphogenesis protein [Halosimplex sp. J119]